MYCSVQINGGNGKLFNMNKAERELLYGEINRLKKVNKKLEDENRRLRGGLEDIERYREKYKEMIESVEGVQKRYKDELKSFGGLRELYRTVRIGNRLYAHKKKLDEWLLNQIIQ